MYCTWNWKFLTHNVLEWLRHLIIILSQTLWNSRKIIFWKIRTILKLIFFTHFTVRLSVRDHLLGYRQCLPVTCMSASVLISIRRNVKILDNFSTWPYFKIKKLPLWWTNKFLLSYIQFKLFGDCKNTMHI